MIALSQLLADPQLKGLVEDSRDVQAGDAYVALEGAQHDGHDFAPQAVANGAVAILAERELPDLSVPVCVVPELKQRRGALAAQVYGEPSHSLRCTGITGTNGKTSVGHYLAQFVSLLPGSTACGYMGTLGWGRLEALAQANLTTVDACSVQRRLASLQTQGCSRVAMEVSSHALVQDRVDAVAFESAIFTNLSRDHLDYHGNMQAYAAAKRLLFDFSSLQRIVTNIDDACGRDIGESKQDSHARVYTYGAGGSATDQASVSWRDVKVLPQGFSGQWCTAWGDAPLNLPLLGRFAIANVAAAMTLLLSEGVPLQTLTEACRHLVCVPGRMQPFDNPGGAPVVVDFAHTPDALEQAALSLSEHCEGKLSIVFGCGGDRDRGKRAQMGQVAARLADFVWLTDDNPRSEDPEAIVADIVSGIVGANVGHGVSFDICHDRKRAIAQAIAAGKPGDFVLVAGKGHEGYQERNGVRTPFSDLTCVADLVAAGSGTSNLAGKH